MSRIKQQYPLTDGQIKATEIQFDLNQLFTTINTLTYENLKTPGSEFDFGTNKLMNLIDPAGTVDDILELQSGVTKNFLKNFFTTKFPSASGDWHKHANMAVLDAMLQIWVDAMTAANDPQTSKPFMTKGGGDLGQNDIDAITGAATHSGSNVFATMDDISGPAAALAMKSISTFTGTDAAVITVPADAKYVIAAAEWIYPTLGPAYARANLTIDVEASVINWQASDATHGGSVPVYSGPVAFLNDGISHQLLFPNIVDGTTTMQIYLTVNAAKTSFTFDTRAARGAAPYTYNTFICHMMG